MATATGSTSLPRPSKLEPDIQFWTRVFTQVDTEHGLIHDNKHLDIVYEVISVPKRATRRARNKQINKVKERYQMALVSLAKGKRKHLSKTEKKVLRLWSNKVSNKTLKAATKRLRFQLGQADKFKAGWMRSGAWRKFIVENLEKHDVPRELASLPHVESSFNPKAYSHVGAAGLWQFTRYTGRRFMRIDHIVDERLDPFISTEAAARLLKYNYDLLGSWPLAITAYNHGAAGMRKASQSLGTTDIVPILRRYSSRTFGFASRNFYPAFLAAVEVDRNAKKYFGPLRLAPSDKTQTITLPFYLKLDRLQEALGMDTQSLKTLNPALRPPVWNGQKLMPRGYELRISCETNCKSALSSLNKIASSERFEQQLPDRFHKVRQGDTLSKIANLYKVNTRSLADFNALRNRNKIRVGQVLRLPLRNPSPSPAVKLAVTQTPTRKPTTAVAKASRSDIYKVRNGDTIIKIAQRFGLDEDTLLTLNDVQNKHRIYVGQSLKVEDVSDKNTDIKPAQSGLSETHSNETHLAAQTTDIDDKQIDAKPLSSAVQENNNLNDPSTEEDTAPLGPTLPSELHPALSADPSDYTVAGDGTIEVQAAETLGHFAHWLGIRTQVLRNINSLRYGNPVLVGKRLKLDFSKVSSTLFEQHRIAYHCEIQEAFFEDFQITDTHTHNVKRGESLWTLTHQKYHLPVWLVHQYNPDLDLYEVRPGMKVIIPSLTRRQESSSSEPASPQQQKQPCDMPSNTLPDSPAMAL